MKDSGGFVDTNKGMAEIMKEIAAMSKLAVKAGIPESEGGQKPEAGGPTVAEYAAWNEYGTANGRIPARPFIRGWVENNGGQIKKMTEFLFKKVSEGEMTAAEAMEKLGQFGESGIKKYIREGTFEENKKSTVRHKGSDKPLIDTGTMRNSIRYEVVGGNK